MQEEEEGGCCAFVLGLPRRLALPGRDAGEAGREEEGLSRGGGIQRSEEEENVRREEALA